MTKRMLIDSTHAEETRVVVLDGNRLEDFDVETSTKRQLKGNIYLAKVVRVEPSLQAAFVEYGGNRHGFLAFGEIHPDYYQIPVADRKRLIEAQEQEAREAEEAEERGNDDDHPSDHDLPDAADPEPADGEPVAEALDPDHRPAEPHPEPEPQPADRFADPEPPHAGPHEPEPGTDIVPETGSVALRVDADSLAADPLAADPLAAAEAAEFDRDDAEAPQARAEDDEDGSPEHELEHGHEHEHGYENELETAPPPEQIGGEHDTEEPRERRTPRFLRNYKIQEVIRRRQILLVQVVKEERGSKGAALTTYISLAGRFSVLMPNSPRGGGISRKITSAADRRRLKEVTAELDLPRGMGLIVRTAGANRPKPEILRDCEYLLNQWDQIRELTMKSMAPALIYEEASLIRRAIRDVYSRDVDEILVDGDQGWRTARDFMRMLMPTHARKVQLWKEPQPLFAKAQVEPMLEAMLAPTVQLKSGGYLVINQTEALVAIDVNSGRATRERGIEETAARTNLEAADEVARQLRLRDLAGLIVIDFIDMENRRNVHAVERRLKEALKHDRARIQVGGISHFGLLEMSRQRLRPSLVETNFTLCAHCGGTGHTRSTESAALHALRAIEEEGGKRRAAEIVVHCPAAVALYILNHKRQRLSEVEARHDMLVAFVADDSLLPPALRIERIRAQTAAEAPAPIQQLPPPEPFEDPDEVDADEADDESVAEGADAPDAAERADGAGEGAEERAGRRRRRRRRFRREDAPEGEAAVAAAPASADSMADPMASPMGTPAAEAAEDRDAEPDAEAEPEGDETELSSETPDRRRRGRRGGRRRRRTSDAEAPLAEPEDAPAPEPAPEPRPSYVGSPYAGPAPYVGPTPANPFGGTSAFDIFDVIEAAEERAAAARAASPPEQRAAPVRDVDPIEPPVSPSAPTIPPPTMPGPVAGPQRVVGGPPAPEPLPPVPHLPEPEPEPVIGPAIQPVVIGAEPVADRKRGWWRR